MTTLRQCRLAVTILALFALTGCSSTTENTRDAKTKQFLSSVRTVDPNGQFIRDAYRAPSSYLVVEVSPDWNRQAQRDRRENAKDMFVVWRSINGRLSGIRFLDRKGFVVGRVDAAGVIELDP